MNKEKLPTIKELLKDYFFDDYYADINRWNWGILLIIIISLFLTHISWWYLLIIPAYLIAFLIKISFTGIREI